MILTFPKTSSSHLLTLKRVFSKTKTNKINQKLPSLRAVRAITLTITKVIYNHNMIKIKKKHFIAKW